MYASKRSNYRLSNAQTRPGLTKYTKISTPPDKLSENPIGKKAGETIENEVKRELLGVFPCKISGVQCDFVANSYHRYRC